MRTKKQKVIIWRWYYKHISTFLCFLLLLLQSMHGRRQYIVFTLRFLIFSTYILIMVLSRFPFAVNLYLTLLAVFSDYGIIPFVMLEVVICTQYVYIWFIWRLTDCFNCLVDFTFLTGIVAAATELIGMEYLEVLKLLFLMTLLCLTFLLRYDILSTFHVLNDKYLLVRKIFIYEKIVPSCI